MGTTLERLEAAIAPAVSAVGAELVDVELHKNHLQVTVERVDGLGLDVLEHAARAISDLLDQHDELAPEQSYELEVSSPGLERRLRRPQHFSHVIGQSVAVRTQPGSTAVRRIEGTLEEASEQGIAVRIASGECVRLSYANIERAHTVFDWKAALSAAKRAGLDSGASAGEPQRAERSRTATNRERGKRP